MNPPDGTAPASRGATPEGGSYIDTLPASALDATEPAGEWQALDIEFLGREIEVQLNGKTVVRDVVDGITGGALSPWEGEPGPLMLQGDHGKSVSATSRSGFGRLLRIS